MRTSLLVQYLFVLALLGGSFAQDGEEELDVQDAPEMDEESTVGNGVPGGVPVDEFLEGFSGDAPGAGSMQDMIEQVKKDLAFKSVGPEGFSENVKAFGHAVDWTEHWIRGLVAFHVILAILVVVTRKHAKIQAFFFFLITGLVFCAQRLNSLASTNWKSFAKQNYFDDRGVFVGVMACAPLFIIGFGQMVMTLHSTANLLVTVKRAELMEKAKTNKKGDGGGDGGDGGKEDGNSKKAAKKSDTKKTK